MTLDAIKNYVGLQWASVCGVLREPRDKYQVLLGIGYRIRYLLIVTVTGSCWVLNVGRLLLLLSVYFTQH